MAKYNKGVAAGTSIVPSPWRSALSVRYGWKSRVKEAYFQEVPLEEQLRIHVRRMYGVPLRERLRSWYEKLPLDLRPQAQEVLKDWYQRNKEAF